MDKMQQTSCRLVCVRKADNTLPTVEIDHQEEKGMMTLNDIDASAITDRKNIRARARSNANTRSIL